MGDSQKPSLTDRLDALLDAAEKRSDAELAREDHDLTQLNAAVSDLFDDKLSAGTKLGNWVVAEKIASGGMATVYRVERQDQQLAQTAALKILPAFLQDRRARERLLRERQILATLNHNHIASLFDAGVTHQGQPWFVMEYVQGDDILSYCRRQRLDVESRVRLATHICEALAYAHAQGIVHRDIKPSNILVRDSDGQVKLLDFGIARQKTDDSLTMTGAVIGTPGYMSPEQARSEHDAVDRRSDVFSLGILLYRLLVGFLPFEGDSTAEITYKIIREDPAAMPGHIARDLRAIIYKCLRKQADDRYQSANALLKDMRAFLAGEPVSARHLSLAQRLKRRIARNPWTSASLAFGVIAVAAAIGWGIYQSVITLNQVRAAERYSYLLQNIQHEVRRMHMMPAHNVQDGYAGITQRIETLENEIAAGTTGNIGAARYALGSAYMTMRNFMPAHEQFVLAEQAGWDTAAFRADYGYAKFIAWENARVAAQQKADESAREQALTEARTQYRDPALALLESAVDAVALTDFLRARIAHSNGDQQAAVAAAERSIAANPWHYESLKLASEAYMQQFLAKGRQQGYDKALPLFESSNTALDKALAIGRSDPYLVISRCSNASVEAQLYGQLQQYDKLSTALDNGIATCERATTLKPDAYSPWVNINLMYATKGDWQEQQGSDATATYQAAVKAGERAVAQYPDEGSIVTAMIKPAVKLAALTDKPAHWFEAAGNYAETAVRVAPDSHRALYEAARYHYTFGQYQHDQQQHQAAKTAWLTALDQIARSHSLSASIGSANYMGRILAALLQPTVAWTSADALAALQQHVPTWLAAIPAEPRYHSELLAIADVLQQWQERLAPGSDAPEVLQESAQQWLARHCAMADADNTAIQTDAETALSIAGLASADPDSPTSATAACDVLP